MVNEAQSRAEAFEQFLQSKSGPKEKKTPVRRMDDEGAVSNELAIPTGITSLDYALGVGGLPRGRIAEFYGPEGGGKTSLALSVCGQAQQAGGYAGVVDMEHAITTAQAEFMGMDLSKAALAQPDSGEDALRTAAEMVESGGFDVVVIDSVAALVPEKELEGDITDESVGLMARMMGKGLRRLSPAASRVGTPVIFINQLREKMVQYGNPETTPGGRALKFYSSVRIEVRSRSSDRIEDPSTKEPIGQTTRVKVVKNKVGPPHREAMFDLYYGKGVDQESALFDTLKRTGLITSQGNTYYDMEGHRLGVGQKKTIEALREDPELAQRLRKELDEQLRR